MIYERELEDGNLVVSIDKKSISLILIRQRTNFEVSCFKRKFSQV